MEVKLEQVSGKNLSSLGSTEAPEIPEEFIGSEPGEEFYEFDEEDTA